MTEEDSGLQALLCQQSQGYQADFTITTTTVNHMGQERLWWEHLDQAIREHFGGGIEFTQAELFRLGGGHGRRVTPITGPEGLWRDGQEREIYLLVVPLKAALKELVEAHLTQLILHSRAFLNGHLDQLCPSLTALLPLSPRYTNILQFLRNANLQASEIEAILSEDPPPPPPSQHQPISLGHLQGPISLGQSDAAVSGGAYEQEQPPPPQFILEKMVLAEMGKLMLVDDDHDDRGHGGQAAESGLFQRSDPAEDERLPTLEGNLPTEDATLEGNLLSLESPMAPAVPPKTFMAPWSKEDLPYQALAKAGLCGTTDHRHKDPNNPSDRMDEEAEAMFIRSSASAATEEWVECGRS